MRIARLEAQNNVKCYPFRPSPRRRLCSAREVPRAHDIRGKKIEEAAVDVGLAVTFVGVGHIPCH